VGIKNPKSPLPGPLTNTMLLGTIRPVKWHLIPFNGFSRVLECDRRHTHHIHTYRVIDHATITAVATGGIAFSDAA